MDKLKKNKGGRPPGAGRPKGGINKKSAIFTELLKKRNFNTIEKFTQMIALAEQYAAGCENPAREYTNIAKVIAKTFPYQFPTLSAVDWNIINPEGQETPKITINMGSQQLIQVFNKDKETVINRDPSIISKAERTQNSGAYLGTGRSLESTPTDNPRPLLPPKRKP